MSLDLTKPATGSDPVSADMRNNFIALKALIDTANAQLAALAAQIAAIPIGPSGPPGPQGLPGINGTNGMDGTNGIDGATGAQGIQGPPGNDGPQGPAGADGAAGADGPQGTPGFGLMNFQGFWQPANPYDAGAVVAYNSVLYITAFAISGSAPPDTDTATWSPIGFPLDGTAKNPSSVLPLGMSGTPFYDPSQFQTVIDRFDQLLASLQRP